MAKPAPSKEQATKRARRTFWVEHGVLAFITSVSLAWSAWWLWDIARSPAGSALVERGAAQLQAAYERNLAREATPEALADRIAARLDQEPRDWVVIHALVDLAEAQGHDLDPELRTRIVTLDAEDNGWLATGVDCLRCSWDLRQCDLNAALACGVAVNLTVLGDLVALTREGGNYLSGVEVDQVDVAISFVGLAATGLVVATGGTSLAVKGGSALIRVAHRTGRLAPDILALFRRAFTSGIDWARLPAVRSADELAALAQPRVLRPAVDVAQDLGRLNSRVGTRQALYLMGRIESAEDAARMGRAADALGPRTLGAFEMLGKSRFMRLTLRFADEVWVALAGVLAALSSGVALLAPLAARAGRIVLRPVLRLILRLVIR